MFHVKICGVTRIEDSHAAVAAGADAIGLNFYPQSKRCIHREQAERIIAQLPSHVLPVGVFVNADRDAVCRLFDELRLGLIQLHGDEPPEYLAQLGDRPVMRAFRMSSEGWPPILAYLDRCRELGCLPRRVLIDAHQPGTYGGTGQTADWRLLAGWQQRLNDIPLVLAGGLTPENVAEAIAAVRPAAVDTASGVESGPGVKDPVKTREFAQRARAALGMRTAATGEPPCQS